MEGQGPLVWLACWSMGGVLSILGYCLQQSEKDHRWHADSRRFGSATYFKRHFPVLLSACTLPLAFYIPEREVMFRCIVSLASGFYFIKTREVLLEDRFEREPLVYRVIGVVGTFHDIQEREPCKPWFLPRLGLAAREGFKLLFHGAGCYMSTWIIHHRFELARSFAESGLDPRLAATGLGCVAACMYSFFSLHAYGDGLALLWIVLGGFTMPPLMHQPERALSVRQFWARWDTVIQKLLRKNVYDPLRKSLGVSSHTAIAATFLASGAVHVYPIFVGLGNDWVSASSMMSYFLVQLFAIFLEKPLGVERWDSTNGLAWTVLWLFGPSYVLVAPVFKLAQLGPP